MKSIVKMFLVSGLILFGLSAFTACSSDVDDTEPEVPVAEASDDGSTTENSSEPSLDFSQTAIAPSPYTYPGREVYPKYIDSTLTIPSTTTSGTPVHSTDNIITVTPRSDGLWIEVNYNATNESKWWKHTSLRIKNITDDYQIEISERDVSDTGANVLPSVQTSRFLFQFSEAGKSYKVWMAHMGVEGDEWGPWGENNDAAAEVTAIGGCGSIRATASDMNIIRDSAGNRVVKLQGLTIKRPSFIPSDTAASVKIRAEKGGRWGRDENGDEVTTETQDKDIYFPLDINHFSITGNTSWSETDNNYVNNTLNNFINNSDDLFLTLTYRFYYEGKKYTQDLYSNWDKWISDYSHITQPEFPLIKIVSTQNNGGNEFVTEPVAHHVKDAQRSWNDLSNVNTPDPWYENCSISVDNGASMAGQVKVRGNWTTNYDKKSLRIKFDSKQNLCGLNGGKTFKNWVLLAVWKDASFLRDAVALKMFKAMFPNYYASDCQLVEVEVNGEYMGVYLLAEQQEVKSDRINITQTDDSAGTDIGYLIEFDKYYTSEVENERFEINYGGNIKDYYGRVLQDVQKGYTIKSDINTAEQKTFIMKYMNRLWRICYDAAYNKKYFKFTDNFTLEEYTPAGANDDEKCKNCISEVIDITSLANMYIYNELVCDPDIYLTSFFMTADFGAGKDRKLRFQAPWDFDSTMGNKRFCTDDTSSGIYVGKNDMFAGACQTDVNCEHERIHANPWMVIFIKQGWFQQLVREQWAGINRTSVLNTLTSYIDGNSTDEYSAVYNYTRAKWGTPAQNDELCTASKTAAASSQSASAEYLKNWLTARFSAVNSIITGLSTN